MKIIDTILINKLEFSHSALKEEYANNLSISVNEFRIGAGIYGIECRIQENESLLEMAKLHMDQRAVFVITERIKELKNKIYVK